jgi:hypothetical protein
MEEPQRSAKYRGYRPPPLWWFKLKYFSGAAVLALFVILATFQVFYALLTGKVSVAFSKAGAVVLWSNAPWTFVAQIVVWCVVAAASFGLFYALLTALRGLRGPSAETRL